MDIEGVSMLPIEPGARHRVSGVIVKAAEFLFEIARRDLRTDVEFQRGSIDARRHGPVAALKFPGYDAIEVHHPKGAGNRDYDARQDEHEAPAKQLGTCHAGFSQRRGSETGIQVHLGAIKPEGLGRRVPR
jgi:hypothetical protein